MKLRVWAPQLRRIKALFLAEDAGETAIELLPAAGGYWQAEVPAELEARPYYLSPRTGVRWPDPRSPSLPRGVHGPTQYVDHTSFAWDDSAWRPPALEEAIIYELHLGTFTPEGTFQSAIAKLDYLQELGVDYVELMPVNAFPGARGWGYDGVGLFAPHRAYGTPSDLKQLVAACHRRGLGVILDVVYNHFGPDGNYAGHFGPYFTDVYTTPWGDAVNLDGAGSDEVRQFFCDNARMWLEDYHFDALRVDAVHAFMDRSAVHLLEQLSEQVSGLAQRLGRRKYLIAESDLNDPRVISPRQAGGYGIDAQWSDDFHHALHAVITGERTGYYGDFGRIEDIATALSSGFVYARRFSAYRQRQHGRPVAHLGSRRLLGYLQTHDQVGNRATGDRMHHGVGGARGPALGRVKAGAALVLLGPFVPMLFQGEEWAASTPFCYFTDHQNSELAEAVRLGRRREFAAFGWEPEAIPDPQGLEAFESSKLRWQEQSSEPHAGMLAWYRDLIRLRREYLRGQRAFSSVWAEFDEAAEWLSVRVGELTLAVNFCADETRELPASGQLLLTSEPASEPTASGVRLGPNSVAVFRSGTPEQ